MQKLRQNSKFDVDEINIAGQEKNTHLAHTTSSNNISFVGMARPFLSLCKKQKKRRGKKELFKNCKDNKTRISP